jgi:hypothetical protein
MASLGATQAQKDGNRPSPAARTFGAQRRRPEGRAPGQNNDRGATVDRRERHLSVWPEAIALDATA